MGAQAVGDRLDKAGAVAGARAIYCLLDDGVKREYVVAVNSDRRHAKSQALDGDAARDGLAGKWRGDGPLIVLAHEHHRRPEHGCEIEARLKVIFAGAAVAHETDNHRALTAHARGPGQAGGVWHL